MKNSYQTGVEGENRACRYLEEKGYRCLENRFKTHVGEIDLIMRTEDTIVFVEVKSRPQSPPGSGLLYVDRKKQFRTARCALAYLQKNHLNHAKTRFDVIEINSEGILHFINAYQPGLPV